MEFQPDYNNILNAVSNRKPNRLPLYEHIISPFIMEKVMDVKFAHLADGGSDEIDEFFVS